MVHRLLKSGFSSRFQNLVRFSLLNPDHPEWPSLQIGHHFYTYVIFKSSTRSAEKLCVHTDLKASKENRTEDAEMFAGRGTEVGQPLLDHQHLISCKYQSSPVAPLPPQAGEKNRILSSCSLGLHHMVTAVEEIICSLRLTLDNKATLYSGLTIANFRRHSH